MPRGATARQNASAKAQERRAEIGTGLDGRAFIMAAVFRLPAQDGMVNAIARIGTVEPDAPADLALTAGNEKEHNAG
jgi:hypothetical protein